MKDNILQVKKLPCDVEMEKYLLGCMLSKSGELVPQILFKLYIDDYFEERNRTLVAAIFDLLINQKKPVNLYSVAAYLKANKLDKKVPALYLMSLPDAVTTTAYIDDAIERVRACSQQRQLLQAASKLAERALSGNEPPAKLMTDFSADFSNIMRRSSTSGLLNVFSYIKKGLQSDIEELARFSNRKTGFANLDACMDNKFAPGLYVLGATPAIGKTTFCWQLLEQLAAQQQHCIYVSYEMDKVRLVTKTLARRAFLINEREYTPSAAAIRNGQWTDAVQKAADEAAVFADYFHFMKFSLENIDELINSLYIATQAWESPVICIDYLQNIPPLKEFAGNTKLSVDDCVRKLKTFQEATKSVVVAISSINRLNYTQPITMEAMKESGVIEYTADVIWGLQMNIVNQLTSKTGLIDAKKAINDAVMQQPREVHLKCLKNREGGNYDCWFDYYCAHDFFEPNDSLEFNNPGAYTTQRADDVIHT